jgi:hypothetical protein
MAIVNGHFSFQVQDYNPTVKPITIPFRTNTGLLADMEANLAALTPLVDAVVGGVINKTQIVIPVALPSGLKASPVALVNNSVAALIDWLGTGTNDKYGVAYPGWYTANAGNGWLPANPKLVNQADAAIAAFIAFMEATTNNTLFVTEDGYLISGVASAIKSTRSTRKQLARTK